MNSFIYPASASAFWMERVGWSLFHFAWQAIVIALATSLLLAIQRQQSPTLRYRTAWMGLATMFAAPLLTIAWLGSSKVSNGIACIESGSLIEARHELPHSSEQATSRWQSNKAWQSDHPNQPLNEAYIGTTPRNRLSLAWLVDRGMAMVQPWTTWIAIGWSLGALCMLTRTTYGYLRVIQWLRTLPSLGPDLWTDRFSSIAIRMGVHKTICFRQQMESDVPAVIGWLRPCVLVPARLFSKLDPRAVDGLIAHEIAHVRRNDYAWNLLLSLLEAVFFFHPAIWWNSKVLRRERELCCDDLAIQATGCRLAYAKGLASLEELRCRSPELAMSARKDSLVYRIQRIARKEDARSGSWSIAFLLSAASTIAFVFVLATTSGIASEFAMPPVQQGQPSNKVRTIEVKQQPWVNVVIPLYIIDGENRLDLKRIKEQMGTLDPKAPVRVICHANARTEWVAQLIQALQKNGFENVAIEVHSDAKAATASEWSEMQSGSNLLFRLVCGSSNPELGKPIPLVLEVKNSGPKTATLDFQTYASFRVLRVEERLRDGTTRKVPFIGMRPQTSGGPTTIAAGETLTVWKDVDLASLFLLEHGTYEVFLKQEPGTGGQSSVESKRVSLKITWGETSFEMQLMKLLLGKLPEKWEIHYGFGGIYLHHAPSNLKKDVASIELSFAEEAPKEKRGVTHKVKDRFVTIVSSPTALERWPKHQDILLATIQDMPSNGTDTK